MARRYQNYDNEGDEEIFDEGGILRDGARWRVPMRTMDSMQRGLDQHFAEIESRDSRWAWRSAHVTDGRGNCPLSLHRPGPRVLDGGTDSESARSSGMKLHLLEAELVARGLERFTRDVPSITKELKLPAFEPGRPPAWPPRLQLHATWFGPMPHDPRFSSRWWEAGERQRREQER
jgi:hypothetical protein